MAVLLHKRPANGLVQSLDGLLRLLSNMAKNGMNHFRLVEALFTLRHIFTGYTTLGKINVTCNAKAPLAICSSITGAT